MRALIAVFLCVLAVGCGGGDDDGGGGDDDGGGEGNRTVAEAKQALIDDCHEGNEGDDRDLKLCQCIADQLAKEHGYDTAKEFDDARKSVADNDVPPEVQSAGASLACQNTQE
jgi:hypothetical protein